jgi:predicted small lipoprotein YifL
MTRRRMVTIALLGAAMLLAGCGDAHPLYGPDGPRNGAGRPVDPVYGVPLPGGPGGYGG